MHKLILPHQRETEGAASKLVTLVKKMESGSCLHLACGEGEHSCDGRSCVRLQPFQREDLAPSFGDITEKEKSEVQIVAECYASTTVNVATALGFFSRVQFTISRDARVRAPFGDSVKRGVSARGVASDPEANQGMEDRS